jgi:pantothenate kinase
LKKIVLLSTTVISISAVITFMAIFVNNSNKQSNIFFIITFLIKNILLNLNLMFKV